MAQTRHSFVLIPLFVFVCSVIGGRFGSQLMTASAATSEDDVKNSVRSFTKVYGVVEENFADTVTPDRGIYKGAIPGMLRTLDPHSNFFDSHDLQSMREEQRGHYYGVGMQVSPRYGKTIVIKPFSGSPAAKAGIRPGDTINAVDGKLTDNLTTTEVADMLKGPRGTSVKITIAREGTPKPMDFDVVRDDINRPSVDEAFWVRPGFAYMHIELFFETTGHEVEDALKKFGVDDRFVSGVASLPTPVTFCEIFPPDHFPLYFYRLPKAPDLEIYTSELDLDAIRLAKIFWVTVTGLSQEPSRSATLAALEARAKSGITVLDLDYRPMFWESREAARPWVQRALARATVAVGNLDECDTAVGVTEPRAAAEALRAFGVELAVVKQGPKGVLATDGTQWVEMPPVPVTVVNGLGAGDAFGGALCHGLLAGWDLARIMRFANAAGALVASRLACADAMPDAAEVEAMLRTAVGV